MTIYECQDNGKIKLHQSYMDADVSFPGDDDPNDNVKNGQHLTFSKIDQWSTGQPFLLFDSM